MREDRHSSPLLLLIGGTIAALLVLLVLRGGDGSPGLRTPIPPEPPGDGALVAAEEPPAPLPPRPAASAKGPDAGEPGEEVPDGSSASEEETREEWIEALKKLESARFARFRREVVPARPLLRPGGRPAARVAPGRARPLPLADLVRSGLSTVVGTAELTGEREPAVEEGVPVGIVGRVLEKETGRPVAGAEVVLRSTFYERSIWYDHNLIEVARVTTDPDGAFRIDRLNVDPVHFGKGGLVYLSARSPDHAPLLARPIEGVTPGVENRLGDIRLSRERHTVRGRVIDEWEGKPVAGGRVVATGEILPIQYPKDQREALFLSAPETTTDDEGNFVLENVGPGNQMLSVHGGNDCIGYQSFRIPFEGEIVLRTRQIRGRIEGEVLDARDRPIGIVRIDGGDNTTHTFADGTFVLENFRGDVVNLRLTHTDFLPVTVPDVADGTKGLVLRMEDRWPEVRFRVVTHEDGAPVPVVAITLSFPPGRGGAMPTSPYHLSGVGVHAVRVPSGAAGAKVSAEGRTPVEVDLTGHRDGDIIDVVLRRK